MGTSAGPHKFMPINWLDKYRNDGRCRGCLTPREIHPITGWVPARAIGDKQRLTLDEFKEIHAQAIMGGASRERIETDERDARIEALVAEVVQMRSVEDANVVTLRRQANDMTDRGAEMARILKRLTDEMDNNRELRTEIERLKKRGVRCSCCGSYFAEPGEHDCPETELIVAQDLRVEKLTTAIRWALGEDPDGTPDFDDEHSEYWLRDGQGIRVLGFWWRTTLRKLAGMAGEGVGNG